VKHFSGRLFSGSANKHLAERIARCLGVELGNLSISQFKDGETNLFFKETIRGQKVFLVQSTSYPVNEKLMELLIAIDAAKRASAEEIIVVIPYFGYARQDRKSGPREPITAKLVANLLTTAGADRVITFDLHAAQIQGFFDIPVDDMQGLPLIASYLIRKGYKDDNIVVVSPDIGGVKRARALAERLHASLAIIDKRRPKPNVSEIMNVIGDVEGKTAIFIDDMIDTGGTIVNAVNGILERGAKEAIICCTHAVFSDPAVEKLTASKAIEIIVTDTIDLPKEKRFEKLTILSVDKMIAECMRRINNKESISGLFNEK